MKAYFGKLLIGLACLLSSASAQAQGVDSLLHEGEYYYIYPFRQAVIINSDYWKLVDDKAFFLDYNNYFNHFSGDYLFDRESFQTAKTPARKEQLEKMLKNRWKRIVYGRGFGNTLTKTLRSRPGELIEVEYNLGKDLLPPFGNIPDGKYVQLFDDFCLVDENGMCQSNPQRIAGIFEIKNNVIEGTASWFNFNGDLLKQGDFAKGLKEGDWKISYPSRERSRLSKWDRKSLKKSGTIYRDTSYSFVRYKNGLEDGPCMFDASEESSKVIGQFEQGEAVGEWTYYEYSKLSMRMTFASKKDTVISHKPLVRGIEMERPRNYYYRIRKKDRLEIYPYSSMMPEFPMGFYTLNLGTLKDNLDMEGEDDRSFELTDASNYRQEYNYYNKFYGSYQDEKAFDPISQQTYALWYLIDSVGMRMNYDGVYEKFYSNGQLFFRYEFVDGHLVSEDTIFWDNGTPHDVVVFEADSNKYYRTLYDRKGTRYDQMIYDSLGAFIEYYTELKAKPVKFMIDSLLVTENSMLDRRSFLVDPAGFYFQDLDALRADSMMKPVVIARTWSYRDTTLQMNVQYDPISHTYEKKIYNCFGEIIDSTTRVFTPNFSGWNESTVSKFDGLTLKRNASGIANEFEEFSTSGHLNVKYPYYYDVTSDERLFAGDELYTGAFNFSYRTGLSKVKVGSKKASVSIQKGFFGDGKYYRALKKKNGNKEMLRYTGNDASSGNVAERIDESFMGLFQDLLYSYEQFSNYSADESFGGFYKVKGEFLDGKAHGIWTSYSKGGRVTSTLNFNKGEPDGELRLYDQQDRLRKRRRYSYSWMSLDERSLDTLPKRKTNYLRYSVNYKNGLRDGKSIEYDWLGRTVTEMNFENGVEEGEMISRESSQYTLATFKQGRLDGYFRTYLTFKGLDTMLLYDINLQHGLLNGESRSYHTNGKLAKRGFFLDGEPIDDYEAYDTLGFKFHYIKFQYSVPVEEKIWEENALSIRYQFNWEDSIPFNPEDITSTMSLESLLARNGYRRYSIEDRYYGRTSLISKEGIECRMTKYYPNDTIARDGQLKDQRKVGLWKFYGYNGNFLYEAVYFDSVIVLNDSIQFKSKGILTDYDDKGNRLYSAYIIEKFEKYDCAHTDHYEVRQLLTIDEVNDSLGRMNGYVYNFYDNGTLQGEGKMTNGLPDGLWKFYDPFGKLNKMGNYVLGKRDGRWLEGDLGMKKYLGEICMNPNLDDLEEIQKYQENLLDITIVNYKMGVLKNKQFYDLNMNRVLELEESKSEN